MPSATAVSLPVEIWLKILHHATSVPHLLDASPPDVFSYSIARRPEAIRRRVWRSLPIKLSAMCVCKLWHSLVRPLLYEVIVVRRSSTLQKLASLLILEAECDGLQCETEDGHSGPLRWTKRLDIKLDTLSDLSGDLNPHLQELLQRAANLQILVIHLTVPPSSPRPPLLDCLATMTTRSLRFVDVSSNREHSDAWLAEVGAVLHRQPLQFLRINTNILLSNSLQQFQVVLPKVEYLRSPGLLYDSLQLPSPSILQHLTITPSCLNTHAIFPQALTLLGEHLRFLELPHIAIWTYGPVPPHSMTLLRDVAAWCPNLRDLVFSFQRSEVPLLSHLDFLPSVANLGLRMDDSDYDSDSGLAPAVWAAVLNDIPRLVQTAQSIQTVRILSRPSFLRTIRNARISQTYELARTVPEACHSLLQNQSVRLEDFAGRLFYSAD